MADEVLDAGADVAASSSSEEEYAARSALADLEVEGPEGGRPNLSVRGGGGDKEDRSWDGALGCRSFDRQHL